LQIATSKRLGIAFARSLFFRRAELHKRDGTPALSTPAGGSKLRIRAYLHRHEATHHPVTHESRFSIKKKAIEAIEFDRLLGTPFVLNRAHVPGLLRTGRVARDL
jgi:hypothetical protein